MLKIHCKGIVQGVGFRPFVCNLANGLGLKGSVLNLGGDGIIYLNVDYVWRADYTPNYTPKKIRHFFVLKNIPILPIANRSINIHNFNAFFNAFFALLPPNAKIHSISIFYASISEYNNVKKHQNLHQESSFHILDSLPSMLSLDSSLPNDVATCKDCLNDVFSLHSRHFHYYLTSCVNCGGRYSLIKSMPYDRHNTAMGAYQMCEKCQKDYANTQSRFYHAQPISCNECAVPLKLYNKDKILATDEASIKKVATLLDSGKIICIKGAGGFALICDSTNSLAIENLRERKNRATKPFAIMTKDLPTAKKIAILNQAESKMLEEKSASIILATQHKTNTLNLALNSIAPNLSTIGILLANTALHHILFHFFHKPIIYTSANLKGEPIITNLQEAQAKLESITEYFLDFEREIYNGIDDSIFRFIAGDIRPIRLARGKTPHNFSLPNLIDSNQNLTRNNHNQICQNQKIIAFGAQDKTNLCYASNESTNNNECKECKALFMLTPYIGDLSSVATQEKYAKTMEFFSSIYDFIPNVLVSDFHPRYESVKIAKQIKENLSAKLESSVQNSTQANIEHLQIYHHHAHLCAILGEIANETNEEILGIIWDGSGLGDNGDIWGGEFLFGGFKGVRRVGHLQDFSLYGGEVAIKEIWRVGYALSNLCEHKKMLEKYNTYASPLLQVAIKKGINSHKTTSVGRLFDGIASLLGILDFTRYEGESGALIEGLYYQSFNIDKRQREVINIDFINDMKPYSFCIENGIVKIESFIYELCEEVFLGVELRFIARRFIHTLSVIALDFAKEFLQANKAKSNKEIKVGFSGGVFQNKALCEEIHTLFTQAKIPHFFHTLVPTNDGGISFGQALFGLYSKH